MANNDGEIILGLNIPETTKNIDGDMKKVLSQIDDLKVTIAHGQLDQKAISEIQKQLNNLTANVSNINVSQGQIKQAQNVGQQIGQQIQRGIKSVTKNFDGEILKLTDLQSAKTKYGKAYFTKIGNSIDSVMGKISSMAKQNQWKDYDVSGIEREDGLIKKLIITYTDAEGAVKRFNMERRKIEGSNNNTHYGLVQIGDVKIIKTVTAAYEEQAEVIDRIRQLTNSQTKNNYGTQISSLEGNFRKIGVSVEDASIKVDKVRKAYNNLQQELNKPITEQNFSEIINLNEIFQNELNQTTAEYQQMQAEAKGFVNMQRRLSLANTIETWNQKNTNATKEAIQSNKSYIDSLRNLNFQMSRMEFDEINRGFKENEISMRSIGRLGASLSDQMKQAANSFTQWISISSAVMGLVYQIKKMPQATMELDAAITDFTMATGANEAKIQSLMKTYGELGSQMKATITDVTVSATEWLKQGQSLADTEKLVINAMVLSKVGKLSSADATKYLTSAMKGYRVEAEDTLDVVDKLSAVDMVSATDVGGLAEAMSGVAASADLAGVSMDRLLGYAAVIGEVTQEGMSEVGTTLNAVFARMGNIKLARLKDYDNNGEDLSNVETVLRGVGINLRDSSNSFRNFDEVLDETANKWNSFSEVQQRAVAQAFSGTHHLNEFIILMQNYSTALEYAEISAESSGEAMKKFEAYEDSIAASTENLRNEFILLSSDTATTELIKTFIDLGTVGVKSIHDIVDAFGLFGTVGLLTGFGGSIKNVGRDKMSSLFGICRQQYGSYTKYKFRYCAL